MKRFASPAALVGAAVCVAAVCLSLAGCVPPYIEALDRAAGLIQHMTTVGSVPPTNIQLGTNPRFFPLKPTASSIQSVDIQSGFVVTDNAGREDVAFSYVDSSGYAQTTGPYTGFPASGADPNYPLYQFEVAATTTTGNLVVFYMNPSSASANAVTLLTATLPDGPLALSAGPVTDTTLLGGPFLLGEQVTPTPSGGPDSFKWLAGDLTNSFAEPTNALTGAANIFTTLVLTPVPKAPLTFQNRFMYYSNASASYAEYYSGGWICYQWTPTSSPVILGGVTHRIDALLTTGDLLSTDGGMLRLYDPNGTQLFSVPMGGLQYCYEAYVGTTPYVFFSLPIPMRHGRWAFSVYAIPTSSMRGLG